MWKKTSAGPIGTGKLRGAKFENEQIDAATVWMGISPNQKKQEDVTVTKGPWESLTRVATIGEQQRECGWKVRFLDSCRALQRTPCQRCACLILEPSRSIAWRPEASSTPGRETAFHTFPTQVLGEAWDQM